jgi:hypothetical protein
MNINKYNVQELSLQEQKEIEGGFFLELLGLAVGLLIGVLFAGIIKD